MQHFHFSFLCMESWNLNLNMDESCRLCRKKTDVFSVSLLECREGMQIAEIVMQICPIKIEFRDLHPKKICDECLEVGVICQAPACTLLTFTLVDINQCSWITQNGYCERCLLQIQRQRVSQHSRCQGRVARSVSAYQNRERDGRRSVLLWQWHRHDNSNLYSASGDNIQPQAGGSRWRLFDGSTLQQNLVHVQLLW